MWVVEGAEAGAVVAVGAMAAVEARHYFVGSSHEYTAKLCRHMHREATDSDTSTDNTLASWLSAGPTLVSCTGLITHLRFMPRSGHSLKGLGVGIRDTIAWPHSPPACERCRPTCSRVSTPLVFLVKLL